MTQTIKANKQFKSLEDVHNEIEMREAKDGGAWSFDNIFGEVTFYSAKSPSKLPDFLIGSTGLSVKKIRYNGSWVGFTGCQVDKYQKDWR